MRMNFIEYGNKNKEVILLLHGGGFSWWNYREAAGILASGYRVILPVLDGHAGSDAGFTSIEENAARIISFIDDNFGGSVLLIGGLSLGGQILLEILSQRTDICRYALIESALAIPSEFTYSMIRPAFGSCYGLIRRRWFAKLQFRSYRLKQELFEDYFRDSSCISKTDMMAFLEANALYSLKTSLRETSAEVHIFVGGKENRAMRKSAEIIHKALPGSELQILPRMVHGAFSMNHAVDYADTVLRIVRTRDNRKFIKSQKENNYETRL